ncbi:MAG: S8 family serine peptidase, partial [Candidatus Hydrogenedentes bacterium]|nr:S8 family serine peptidase [Candidatus Hydrogenedentota bacterium]
SRRVSPIRISAVFLTLLVAMASSASGGEKPAKLKSSVQGERIYYYSGDTRVEMTLSLDELVVTPPATKGIAPTSIKSLIPTATTRSLGPKGEQHVKLAAPAPSRSALEQQADALEAAGYEVSPAVYGDTVITPTDNNREVLTNQFSLKLKGEATIDQITAAYGVSVVSQVDYSPNTYIVQTTGKGLLDSLNIANALYESGLVEFATPFIERKATKKLVPNDTLYPNQWHLKNTGQQGTAGNDVNIQSAWDQVTGAGINIAIVDDGLETAHEDLAANARTDIDIDIDYGDNDPTPDVVGDDHGTSCAGVAAAKGNNALGVCGAAFNASLVGVRLISLATTDAQDAQALGYLVAPPLATDRVSISSNSWGPADDGATLATMPPLTAAAVLNGIQNGRGGLGTIYVWAAGNGRQSADNVNFDGYASSRYTIAVGASGANGVYSPYSEPGCSMLVNTPSNWSGGGITTTDRTGSAGYDVTNYTNSFGGTSSATPLAAGIIALMLEKNSNLTWRDVQHILVNTAFRNDPLNSGWSQNGAGLWYNPSYGFGRIDATAAVNAAGTWTNVAASAPSLTASKATAVAIPDNNTAGVTQTVSISGNTGFEVEHVEVTVNITHPYRGDLRVFLTSPSGMVSQLASERAGDSGDNFSNWKFTSVAHWGENPNGTWQLKVADVFTPDTGTLNSWSIQIYGTVPEDSDSDGISDIVEGTGDPDNDTIPNYLDPDSDGDGINDSVAGDGDVDGDSTPNFLDLDADGDGLSNAYEQGVSQGTDVDNDGTLNFLDTDSDEDGAPDSLEVAMSTDPYDALDVPAVPIQPWPIVAVCLVVGVILVTRRRMSAQSTH